MHKLPFPTVSWRAKAPLELVHAEAFSHFMQFKALTENQNGYSLKILRTENLQASNLTVFVRSMELKENLQQGLHLNKMESQKGKTAL